MLFRQKEYLRVEITQFLYNLFASLRVIFRREAKGNCIEKFKVIVLDTFLFHFITQKILELTKLDNNQNFLLLE